MKIKKKKVKKSKVEEIENRSTITNYFDGELIWTTITGIYSWFDGEWSHKIELANLPQFWSDFMNNLLEAIRAQKYRRDVIPQIIEEVGDMSFAEYDTFPWRNYYV